jgi:hypothetical protein
MNQTSFRLGILKSPISSSPPPYLSHKIAEKVTVLVLERARGSTYDDVMLPYMVMCLRIDNSWEVFLVKSENFDNWYGRF